ncbi:hypothetical protein L7F22_042068 [Adiantum nelumboides]|nr:hypothetical protein [Adiantum nelumboides]
MSDGGSSQGQSVNRQGPAFSVAGATEMDDSSVHSRSSLSKSPSASEVSLAIPSAGPILDQRRAERMRGAGTHAISQRQVAFPVAAASSSSSSINTPASSKRTMSLLSARPTPFLSSDRPQSSSPAPSILGIEQRRQERTRGAATHAIESRNVNFPTQSPASISNIASTPISNKPVNFPTRSPASISNIASTPVSNKPVNFLTQSPASTSSIASITPKVSKPPFSIAELQRRRQERMRGSGKHAIERQEVEFPSQSPVSTLRAPSEARSEASTSSISHVPESQTHRMTRIESPALPSPNSSRTFENSAFAIPLLRARGRPRKYMKAATGEEVIMEKDLGEVRAALYDLQSNLSTSNIPDIEQRKMERVRGSGTHAIERQRVQFPNPSPASSSILDSSQMPTSDPTYAAVSARKDGATLQHQRSPPQATISPAPSSIIDRSELPTSEPSFVVPNIDQRKLQRVRGAATHTIEPQRVQFPGQSPSSSSTLDRTEMPNSEPSMMVPDIEQRRLERVKGAGVHPVQPRTVGFPEQSPASTIQTTFMNDTSQFDNSFLDPALMDANMSGEYQIAQPEDDMMLGEDDVTLQQGDLQPEEDRTMVEEPKESTPTGKRKRSNNEADFSRETSITTEGSTSRPKLRKRLPPPSEFDPKLRRAIDAPLPLWQNPRSYLTNEEKTEAQMQLADIMELCIRRESSISSSKTVGPSDADVIYTLIKREFQKVAKTLPKQKRPFLSEVLDELVIHFRQLSQRYTTRHQLIKDLRLAQEKKKSMRRIVHEQRGNVVEALRSIDGLKQQQERKIFKSKNDRRIASFLTDLRERYAPLWN